MELSTLIDHVSTQSDACCVFTNSVRTFGVTSDDLQRDAATTKARDLASIETMYDAKFAYVLNPLQRVQTIGSDLYCALYLVDLSNNQQLPGFQGHSKALELYGEAGMPGTTHLLLPYSQAVLSVFRSFNDFDDDYWQNAYDKALADAPKVSLNDSLSLELPNLSTTD